MSKLKEFKYFAQNDSDVEKISKINTHINKKIKEFSELNDVSLDLVLINIKSIISKKYEIEKIESVLKYFPLKYFVVEFVNNELFRLKSQFPFLKYIIYRKLLKDEVFNYFKDEKYLKKLIENEKVKRNYFEEAVKFGLKENIELPIKLKIYSSIEVKEIGKIEEINKNSIDYYNLDEESKDEDLDEINMDYSEHEQNIPYTEEQMNKGDNFQSEKIQIIKIKKQKKQLSNNKELEDFLNSFDISEDININFTENSLEWFRKKEISNLINGKYEIKKSDKKYDGNKTYFLEQKKRVGRTLDCGILYGNEKNKTFIGFKCFFDSTLYIKDKATNKDLIKESIKEILINSMLLLNCKITSWYYYLVFYYNPKKKELKVNKSIIDKIQGIIEILYYDPLKKTFYDINLKPLKHLLLTDKANLDITNINYGMISLNLVPLYASNCGLIIGKEEVEESFRKDFSFFNQVDINGIITNILNIMNIKDENYRLKHKIVKLPSILTFPSYNCIFLYKRNNNRGFIAVKSEEISGNGNVKFYDLIESKEINFLENDCEYLYTLQKNRNNIIKGDNISQTSIKRVKG